jgi:NADPH:quinone reductase-like Zn-dependent oxidoreductase
VTSEQPAVRPATMRAAVRHRFGSPADVVEVREVEKPEPGDGEVLIAKLEKSGMETLRELLEAGKVTPVVDRRYPLEEIGDALEYLGEGHCPSKIVVTI